MLAQRDAAIQAFSGESLKLVGRTLNYRFGTVTLTFYPGSSVKWFYWGLALTAMPEFFSDFEFVGFDFMVLDTNAPAGVGNLGGGNGQ